MPAEDDKWQFAIAFPMMWAPQINGKIRGGEPVDFTIEFEDLLEDLSFGISRQRKRELPTRKGVEDTPGGFRKRVDLVQVDPFIV